MSGRHGRNGQPAPGRATEAFPINFATVIRPSASESRFDTKFVICR